MVFGAAELEVVVVVAAAQWLMVVSWGNGVD